MSRVGIGFDAHRFEDSRPLVLGGVTVPGPGLAGHSDADVLSHAVADAILGAAALGDLGEHFPDAAEWRDASSLDILIRVVDMAEQAGWMVGNVDASLIAERPRLAAYRASMSEKIAAAIGVPVEKVSVKATSTDGLGAIGRAEGIAAMAVVSLESNDGG